MADTLATLIIKLVADHAELTTGVKKASTEVDGLSDAFARMDADRPFVRATESAGSFSAGLGQVDRTLSRFGVNLTPAVAALREMEFALGKTASQLGVIGTVGLTAAAALGGWQLGRLISETFDLDTKIGDLTARLLGFGDVAAATADAKLDLLARATKIAGFEITQYGAALKIVTDEQKRLTEAFNAPEAAFDRIRTEAAAAQREYRGLSDATRIQIERLLEWGKSSADVERILRLKIGTVDVLIERKKLKAEQDKQGAEVAAAAAKKEEEAHAKMVTAKEAEDTKYRDFRNWIGERMMEDEAARMQQEAAAHAAHLAEMAAAEAALPGLIITGQSPSKPSGNWMFGNRPSVPFSVPAPPSGVVTFAEGGIATRPTPGIFGEGGPEALIPLGKMGGFGTAITVHVDARDSFYDTPAGIERLADRVGHAITSRLMRHGGAVR